MGFLGYNVMLIIERITNDKAYIADNESGVMITADISEVVAAAGDVVVLTQNRYITDEAATAARKKQLSERRRLLMQQGDNDE